MKKLFTFCLLALPLCCFSQTKTANIDSLFEKYCVWGVICETELSKYEFDTSESVILIGFARNCSETDSVFFAMVPTGANYNMKYNLRNFSDSGVYDFMDFDLLSGNHSIAKGGWKTIQRKLAPGERVEVFSFDLKKLHRLQIGGEQSQKHIFFFPGIYEFTWKSLGAVAVSKPTFFEIKW